MPEIKSIVVYQGADLHYYLTEDGALKTYGDLKCVCGEKREPSFDKLCRNCRQKEWSEKERERIAKMPFVEWDGKFPLTDGDEYFFDEEDIANYIENQEIEEDELVFFICIPNYLNEVSSEYWSDVLAQEADDVPEAVREKLDEFNAFIKQQPPVSWGVGKKKVMLNKKDFI